MYYNCRYGSWFILLSVIDQKWSQRLYQKNNQFEVLAKQSMNHSNLSKESRRIVILYQAIQREVIGIQ